MKKVYIHVQGPTGTAPVRAFMKTMLDQRIPFINMLSSSYHGSKKTYERWYEGLDLLVHASLTARVREQDLPLIHVLNTSCVIKEYDPHKY